MRRVVALLGLSGVGKSTLVRRVQARRRLLHLQASNLIKAEQMRRGANVASSEELRLGTVLDNQNLLINGFVAATDGVSGLVVFDGHAVIFAESGVTEIPSAVFAALGCVAIIIIEADAATICSQQLNDPLRVRPKIDEAHIRRQQAYSTNVAGRIAAELGVPFYRIAPTEFEGLIASLQLPVDA